MTATYACNTGNKSCCVTPAHPWRLFTTAQAESIIGNSCLYAQELEETTVIE